VKKGVTVVRDGKRVRPEIGKNFDFTAEEIERITEVDPSALGKAEGGEDGEAAPASTTAKTTTTTDKPSVRTDEARARRLARRQEAAANRRTRATPKLGR
jgi:hypothetical protein